MPTAKDFDAALPSATGNLFGRSKNSRTNSSEPTANENAPVEEKSSETKSTVASTPAAAASAEPFANFPRVTDLPDVDDLTETSLGNLVIGNRYLLGAEIHADPAIGRSPMIFEMNRDANDNQKWLVTVRRREKDKPIEIAYFKKTETELLFGWLPTAAKNKYAPFLCNCMRQTEVATNQPLVDFAKADRVGTDRPDC